MLIQWQETAFGQTIFNWEQQQLDELTTNIFGYYALQLGLTEHDLLHANRMPYKWRAQLVQGQETSQLPQVFDNLIVCPEYLPFASNSIDLLLLPHTLETSENPMQVLREVERVLVPEGRILLTCLNPWRNFTAGLQKRKTIQNQDYKVAPTSQEWLSHKRLTDWLKLLGFEIELLRFGVHRPVIQSASLLNQFNFLDQLGSKILPISGAVFLLMAVKRVPSIRLLSTKWPAQQKSTPIGVPIRKDINKNHLKKK